VLFHFSFTAYMCACSFAHTHICLLWLEMKWNPKFKGEFNTDTTAKSVSDNHNKHDYSGHCPLFWASQNATFWILDLFLSWGIWKVRKERFLLRWAPLKKLVMITGHHCPKY
jgi:hypothetical protein